MELLLSVETGITIASLWPVLAAILKCKSALMELLWCLILKTIATSLRALDVPQILKNAPTEHLYSATHSMGALSSPALHAHLTSVSVLMDPSFRVIQ
jgi:hypothetical protein